MSPQNIIRPQHPRSHPDRFTECQRAVEDSIINVIGDASDAGWDRDEILAAIIAAADDMALALNSNNTLLSAETELARLNKRKGV